MLYGFAYQAPSLLGPGWEAWPLTPQQAQQCAIATEGLVRSLPKRSKDATTKALSKWLPWLTFATTLALITWPRVLITQNHLRAQRFYRDRGPTPAGSPAGGPDGAPPNGGPDGAAPSLRTWADLRRAE